MTFDGVTLWILFGQVKFLHSHIDKPFLYEFPVVPGTTVVMRRERAVLKLSTHFQSTELSGIVWKTLLFSLHYYSLPNMLWAGSVLLGTQTGRWWSMIHSKASESFTLLKQMLNTVFVDLRPVSARPWTRFHEAPDEQCVLTELPGADWILILSVATEDSRCFDRLLHDCAAVAARHLHLATTSICWALYQDRHLMYWLTGEAECRWDLRPF